MPRNSTMMIEHVDQLYETVHADLLRACAAAGGTAFDALQVAQRLWIECLAAHVAEHALSPPGVRWVIEAYGRQAAAQALAVSLVTHGGREGAPGGGRNDAAQ